MSEVETGPVAGGPLPAEVGLYRHFFEQILRPHSGRPLETTAEECAWYDRFQFMTDTLSDELAASIQEGPPGGFRKFNLALRRGIEAVDDPSPQLVAFIADAERVPEWLDRAAVERGAAVLRRMPLLGGGLAAISLGFHGAYWAANSNRALASNGSTSDAAERRMVETMQYFGEIYSARGLERFSEGFITSCRVRLVHGFVRGRLRANGGWEEAVYGAPIPLALLPAAMASGTSITLNVLMRFGARYTERQLADVAMFTTEALRLQGCPAELIDRTHGDHTRRLWLCYSRSASFVDDDLAQRMVDSFRSARLPTLPDGPLRNLSGRLTEGHARLVWGDPVCDRYGMGGRAAAAALRVALPALNLLERALDAVPPLAARRDRSRERFWAEGVADLLESYVGARRTDFSHQAQSPTPAA